MMRYAPILFLLLISLSGCQRVYVTDGYQYSRLLIDEEASVKDSLSEELIRLYRRDLNTVMDEVIAQAAMDLPKQQPECLLGNVMTDAMLAKAKEDLGSEADIAIMNYGGIRVPVIPKGPVTVGMVYELMPFDNFLVVLELKGHTLDSVFQHIANKGGWPVAGASFRVSPQGNPYDVTIKGRPLENDAIYSVAISDYLASGGDGLDLLERYPQIKTSYFLRDAFISYFKDLGLKGVPISSSLTGNIQYDE